jgi:aldehyde dehydrogenase family 7 member A1
MLRTRGLSSRASAVLSALDIPTEGTSEIPGVYDGAWGGSGELLESRCPATGEVLARVKSVGYFSTSMELAVGLIYCRHVEIGDREGAQDRYWEVARGVQGAQACPCSAAWRNPATDPRGYCEQGQFSPSGFYG